VLLLLLLLLFQKKTKFLLPVAVAVAVPANGTASNELLTATYSSSSSFSCSKGIVTATKRSCSEDTVTVAVTSSSTRQLLRRCWSFLFFFGTCVAVAVAVVAVADAVVADADAVVESLTPPLLFVANGLLGAVTNIGGSEDDLVADTADVAAVDREVDLGVVRDAVPVLVPLVFPSQ